MALIMLFGNFLHRLKPMARKMPRSAAEFVELRRHYLLAIDPRSTEKLKFCGNMRRIISAYSAQSRIHTAREFLVDFAEQEVLFVAASRPAADEVVRGLVLDHGMNSGVHRFTLPFLAFEIAGAHMAADGLSVLSGVAVDALAARATESCRSRGVLHWFEPIATTPGYFRALASTIADLRMNDVDLEKLAASGRAGADLAELVRAFEAALHEARLADLPVIYQLASGERSRYRGMPLLLMDVIPKSVVERRFIKSLLHDPPVILATVHSRNEPAIVAFEEALGVVAKSLPDSESDALGRLRKGMFSPSATQAGGMDSTVAFRSASDESREAVEIARSILNFARIGVQFDRIAILVRNADLYQPLIEDAFRRAEIPGFYTHGSKRPNPTGRAFLALLACAADGLSASRFGEYLSLGQVPEPEEPVAPTWVPVQGELFPAIPSEPTSPRVPVESVRAPYAWEQLLVDAAVIGGQDRWERRLTGLDREIERQIDEIRAEDESRLVHLERQRMRLRDLRRFAIPLIDRLARLPKSAIWGDWLDALEQLATHALRQPEAVISALEELRPMANVGPVTLDEVREVIGHRLTFLRTEPAERRYGKVFVGTIGEAPGMSFEVVFVPGLGEDIFPKRAFEDPLLLDDIRKSVSPDLSVQDTRVAEERFLFHTACGSAARSLIISYPRMNLAQARPRGPSFYAMEVVRAITGRVPNLQELQQMAADSSQSQGGWPAPRDPAVAVDDTEFDLSSIARLLRIPLEEAKGGGRYLMLANENLARSLRSRNDRWRGTWTESDGIIDADPATLQVLSDHRISARPYSATALQQFAACPYRFLLYAIHRLQARTEIAPLERMDALTRGSLFHSIQFHLLTELRDRNLIPITIANRNAVIAVADAVIDRVSETYREELAPAIPRIWEGEIEDVRWDVRGWLREATQAEDDTAWKPRWFELSFGLPRNRACDPASASSPVDLPGGLHLRGSIDLIEERKGRLRITDHKTGKVPTSPPGFTGRGEVLQPVLYARAAEIVLHKPAESACLFYCTERGGYRTLEVPINDESQAALERVIQTIDTSLSTGFLPAAPRDAACTWCDYRVVCGPYEETRIRRKPADRLEPLVQIRK